MSMNNPGLPLVTRTMRAAVKVGDDYFTIEETISLQPGATEDQIAQAICTGMMIYDVQCQAVEEQIQELRGRAASRPAPIREPDAPASEKQRQYLEYLLKELGWSNEQLVQFATERQRNLLTLTKCECSELIDELKGVLAEQQERNAKQAEQRDAERNLGAQPTIEDIDRAMLDGTLDGPEDDENDPLGFNQSVQQQPQRLPIAERATQRQIRALERLVDERGIDLDGELRRRFGDRALGDLSMDEAGQLLSEWQQRPRVYRPAPPQAQRPRR